MTHSSLGAGGNGGGMASSSSSLLSAKLTEGAALRGGAAGRLQAQM